MLWMIMNHFSDVILTSLIYTMRKKIACVRFESFQESGPENVNPCSTTTSQRSQARVAALFSDPGSPCNRTAAKFESCSC